MSEVRPTPQAEPSSWTLSLRRFLQRTLPMKHLLPDRQPVFVGSWVYIFGVVAIAGLIWVVGSGRQRSPYQAVTVDQAKVLRPRYLVSQVKHLRGLTVFLLTRASAPRER